MFCSEKLFVDETPPSSSPNRRSCSSSRIVHWSSPHIVHLWTSWFMHAVTLLLAKG